MIEMFIKTGNYVQAIITENERNRRERTSERTKREQTQRKQIKL